MSNDNACPTANPFIGAEDYEEKEKKALISLFTRIFVKIMHLCIKLITLSLQKQKKKKSKWSKLAGWNFLNWLKKPRQHLKYF